MFDTNRAPENYAMPRDPDRLELMNDLIDMIRTMHAPGNFLATLFLTLHPLRI
jgi:hypothetical protein